jgi:integrase
VSIPIQMVLKSPVGVGREMPRDRHQTGWVHKSPYKRAKWYGEYFVYRRATGGEEKRVHKTAILGLCSSMKRSEAMKALQKIIEAEAGQSKRGDASVTFAWFAKNRYMAMHGPSLKDSSREVIEWLLNDHLIPEFGEIPLMEMDRYQMQTYLKWLADKGRSSSFIHKARTYLKAILDEAVDQEYIPINRANLLEAPRVAQKEKRYLKPWECKALIESSNGRERLMVELLIFCAFRPGELLALRWDDWEPGRLRIDEGARGHKVDTPKTAGSIGFAAIPASVELELRAWKERSAPSSLCDLIFPGRHGRPIPRWDFSKQILGLIAAAAGLKGITCQAIRRTAPTLLQKVSTPKDIQAQMRHASPVLTIGTYMQAIPESVRQSVQALEQIILNSRNEREMNENRDITNGVISDEPILIQ